MPFDNFLQNCHAIDSTLHFAFQNQILEKTFGFLFLTVLSGEFFWGVFEQQKGVSGV